ncbi:MAG TPA: hypothetical protein VF082_05265 [Jiangellaceae bacterium]
MTGFLTSLGRIVLACATVLSGGYTVYYLYQWQWVRAQIAGITFVATLVIGATILVLARIDRLERDIDGRLDDLERRHLGRQDRPPRDVPADGDRSQHDFPWLSSEFAPPRHRQVLPMVLAGSPLAALEPPRVGVFIPVLLGAGIAVSIVASLIERIAAGQGAGQPVRHAERSGGRRLAARSGVLAVVIAVATAAVYWAAHYRPERLGDGTTELSVQVLVKDRVARPVETVEMMARYCARNAISGVRVERVAPESADTALLVVSPLLDEEAQRRFGGCLADANLDRHRLAVTRTVLVPAEGFAGAGG